VGDPMKLVVMALATGSISMTLARSRMFREVRWWLARGRPEWVWDFVKCPWCMSHWIAAGVILAIGKPVAVAGNVWLDFVLTWMAVVALAPAAAFLIYRCYGDLPPVPTEQEWKFPVPDDDEVT